MPVRYRYARDVAGALTAVDALTPATRAGGAPYACLGCGHALVPRLGTGRVRPHFAHKARAAADACGPETYLHRLAKQAFADAYRARLAAGRPFPLARAVTRTCTHYQAAYGLTCAYPAEEAYDLTRYFDRVDVEAAVRVPTRAPTGAPDAGGVGAPPASHAEFRADVLLSSSRHADRRLLVEFAVTHPCSPAKRASGLRIVELTVAEEADVTRWAEGIPAGAPGVEFLNFAPPGARDAGGSHCGGRCGRRTVDVFLVYPSGKSILVALSPAEVAGYGARRRAVHAEVLGPSADDPDAARERYRDRVRAAHFAGVPVRNCFLCRYHGADGLEAAVFCRVRRAPAPSNDAAACGAYRPLPTPAACAAADAANAEYRRTHGTRLTVRHVLGRMFPRDW